MKYQVWHDGMKIKEFDSECEALFFIKKISNAKEWHEINWKAYQLKEVA